MLSDIAKDQIGRNRRRPVEAGFTPFALDVVLTRVGKASKRLHASLTHFPSHFRGQMLSDIRLRTTVNARVKQSGSRGNNADE